MEIARNPSSDGIAALLEGSLAADFDSLHGNASVTGAVEPSGHLTPRRDKARQNTMRLRAIDAVARRSVPSESEGLVMDGITRGVGLRSRAPRSDGDEHAQSSSARSGIILTGLTIMMTSSAEVHIHSN